MKVDKSKKIHARFLEIEVGTKCNLKCKHCYLGDAPELTIKPEYIDAILENVYEIDDLLLAGGEITLYLDEVELVLEKIIKAKIKINYICFVTNGVIKSKRLVKLFEQFRQITTFPQKAGIRVSIDEFHLEQSGKTEKDMNDIIKWYQERVGGIVEANRLENSYVLLEGRAKESFNYIVDNYKNVAMYRRIKCIQNRVIFNPLCKGKENVCGYGCVKNCFTSQLCLASDGYLYVHHEGTYDLDDRSNAALCHIMDKSIYDAVTNWNNDCQDTATVPFVRIKSDSVGFRSFLMNSLFSWFTVNLLEAYERNNVKQLLLCATVMDYGIKKWNNYLKDNSIGECIETISISEMTKYLMKIYALVFSNAIRKPTMQNKETKTYIITELRKNESIDRIFCNIFISYIAKNLDDYIKYFDELAQWAEKNDISSDKITHKLTQWIKENNTIE